MLPTVQRSTPDSSAWHWVQTCSWALVANLTRALAVAPDAAHLTELRDAIARLTRAHRELARTGHVPELMHCAVFVPGCIEVAYYALAPNGRVALCIEGTHGRVYRFDVCSPALHETLAPLLVSMAGTQVVSR
ncbi:hypothetical protein DF039_30405 [Burkholderia cenocepacia]|nr:hypothetical protein DF039_30405 [Burkholderia cenocepacia]